MPPAPNVNKLRTLYPSHVTDAVKPPFWVAGKFRRQSYYPITVGGSRTYFKYLITGNNWLQDGSDAFQVIIREESQTRKVFESFLGTKKSLKLTSEMRVKRNPPDFSPRYCVWIG